MFHISNLLRGEYYSTITKFIIYVHYKVVKIVSIAKNSQDYKQGCTLSSFTSKTKKKGEFYIKLHEMKNEKNHVGFLIHKCPGGWSAIPYPPKSPMQKLHFFIVLYCIFPEIIIPEISDQLVRNFFADQSAK